jgi:hypothetical protein
MSDEAWPEEATWTERLLAIASGDAPRTPEVEAALRDDPRVAALWADLQALETALPPGTEGAPRLAVARAREAFEAEARPGLLERLRGLALVPALAGVVALALGLGPTPGMGPAWDAPLVEAHLETISEDLLAWEEELAPAAFADSDAPLAWEPRELAFLVRAEDPEELWYGSSSEEEAWAESELDPGSPWDSLEGDLTRIEQALERL